MSCIEFLASQLHAASSHGGAWVVMAIVLAQVWPEEQFPLQEFGKMVLDENIKNYFTDVESIAFDPGVTVPGTLLSF